MIRAAAEPDSGADGAGSRGLTILTGDDGPATRAAGQVVRLLDEGARPGEVAVLARVNASLAPVQVLLRSRGIPVDGGVSGRFLQRGGVRAALAWMALSAAPDAAQFTWRASCTWRKGTHSHSTVTGFTGLGAEQQHRNTYEYDVDHPECFASEDNGATPVEVVLVSLASCLTAGVAAVAQYRDIQLRSVTATIEGQMNVLGILGADPDIRNGFEAVTVRFAIDADAPREDLEALIAQASAERLARMGGSDPTAKAGPRRRARVKRGSRR